MLGAGGVFISLRLVDIHVAVNRGLVLGLHLFKQFLTSVSFSFPYMIRIAHLCLFAALSLLRYLDASGLTFMDDQLKKKRRGFIAFLHLRGYAFAQTMHTSGSRTYH